MKLTMGWEWDGRGGVGVGWGGVGVRRGGAEREGPNWIGGVATCSDPPSQYSMKICRVVWLRSEPADVNEW